MFIFARLSENVLMSKTPTCFLMHWKGSTLFFKRHLTRDKVGPRGTLYKKSDLRVGKFVDNHLLENHFICFNAIWQSAYWTKFIMGSVS